MATRAGRRAGPAARLAEMVAANNAHASDLAAATIIVVSYNSARYLARLLAALGAQTERSWRLILIDNASRPEQRPDPRMLPPRAQLIQLEHNIGFAAANNLAIGECATQFIACLNPDAFPEPDWLASLLNAADRWPHAAAFGSTQLMAETPHLLDGAGDAMHALGLPYRALQGKSVRKLPPCEGKAFSACAAAALYRGADLRAIGGFEESFFCFCEDVDLGFRLRLVGRVSIQVPEAIVHHVGGGSTGPNSEFAAFHGVRNRLWVLVRNMPAALFWPLFPLHLIVTAAMVSLHAIKGRGFAGWRGLIAGLAGLGPVWRARRKIQRSRTASAAEIARALTWSPAAYFSGAPKPNPGANRRPR